MRILRVISSMDPVTGGPCQGIRNSVPTMTELGVRTEVACLDDAADLWHDPFPVHPLGKGRSSWNFQPQLKHWLDENLPRFDAVIAHGLWQYPAFAVRRAAKRAGTPYFVFPHGMLDPWFQRAKSRRLKAVRNWWYWKFIEQEVIRDAAGLLFTCEEEMRLARQTFRPYEPRRELVVGYGVPDPPPETPAMRRAFRSRCPDMTADADYLLFVGRLHPKKGIEELLKGYAAVLAERAHRGLTTPHLVVAGPGTDTPYGRSLLEQGESVVGPQGEPAVHFVGMLTGDAKWGAIYGAQALVLPSHQENFGIAVVEALACGTPVLLSSKVNIWREIVQDRAGLAADDTWHGTKKLICEWLASQLPDHSNPRVCFEKRFSQASANTRFLDAISTCV